MRLVDDCHSAVIAGAGIGGATAALVLARAGVEVTLCERVANPTAVGAGIVLQPNGLAVLYALGLADALQASASRITRAVVRAGGRTLLEEPIPDFGGGLDHALALPRSALSAILLGAVRASPRIDLRLGSHVRQVRIAGDGVVVESGADLMELRADLVIGADGVRSAVRAFVAPGARDRFAGYSYVRALVAGEWRGFTGEWWTPLGLFGVAPVGGAGIYFFTSVLPGPVARAVEGRDLDAYRTSWVRVLPDVAPILARLRSFDELLVNDVRRVDCPTFARGRVALLGDAAHAMAPNLGQGANSAIVDAAVLRHALATAPSVAAALAAYDARRRPAVKRVQDDAARFARVAQLRPATLRRLRDRLLPLLARGVDRRRAAARVMQEDPRWLAEAADEPAR